MGKVYSLSFVELLGKINNYDLDTIVESQRGDKYKIEKTKKNKRKFSRIENTKLRFLTYDNLKVSFRIVEEEQIDIQELKKRRAVLPPRDILDYSYDYSLPRHEYKTDDIGDKVNEIIRAVNKMYKEMHK